MRAGSAPRLRSLGGQAAWSVLDQAASSLGTLLLAVAVGRSSGIEEFGAYATAIAAYGLSLTASRALVSMPFLMRVTERSADDRLAPGSLGAAALASLVGVAALVVIGSALTGPLRGFLLLLAAALPALLLQDAYRYLLQHRVGTRAVALNDLVWTGVQAALSAALLVIPGADRPLLHMAAWAFGAACAAGGAARRCGAVPTFRDGRRYLRTTRDVGPPLLVESLAIAGSNAGGQFALTAAGGPAALAPVKGALVAFGPVNVVNSGLLFLITPMALRAGAGDRRRVLVLCSLFALVVSVASLATTAAALLLPRHVGLQLLGPTWDAAREVLLPTGLAMAAYGVQSAAMLGFRAHRVTGAAMRLRLATFPVPAVAGTTGLYLGGPVGAAHGLLVGALAIAALLWTVLIRLPRRPAEEDAPCSSSSRRTGTTGGSSEMP